MKNYLEGILLLISECLNVSGWIPVHTYVFAAVLGRTWMREGQGLLASNLSLSSHPHPLKHICSRTARQARRHPECSGRENNISLLTVDKVSRQLSAEAVLPPADR